MSDHDRTGTIRFEHVSKRYRLGGMGSLRGAVSGWLSMSRAHDEWRRVLWALRDVTFCVERGGSLGLIGPNGAGKSTTLKLLSNITRPTSGCIAVHGRVSSLIELGAGFHPELSGRENIYLNGAILGLKRQEVTQRLDEIVAFSELERFIDTPLKRYSSGMYVRLGFAVAAHVEPDILLVDEVLAVGDASFRHRCVQHMQALRRQGTTVVFVSHNMHLVRSMCARVVLLMNGRVCAEGEPNGVIAEYEQLLLSGRAAGGEQVEQARPTSGCEDALILTAAEMVGAAGPDKTGLISGLPARLNIYYKASVPQQIGRVDIRIVRDDGTLCCTADSSQSVEASEVLDELTGSGVIEVLYDPLQLTTGHYVAMIGITDPTDTVVVGSLQSKPLQVFADGVGVDRGVYVPRLRWSRRDAEC